MRNRITGVLSLLLVFAALGLAAYQLWTYAIILGILYLLAIPSAFLMTLYNYCRKCPHVIQRSCRHVFFGWIVLRLMKPTTPSQYTKKEVLLSLVPLALIILLPQYWLFQSIGLFIIFWALMLMSILMVFTSVCKGCHNTYCSFCPNKNNCPS